MHGPTQIKVSRSPNAVNRLSRYQLLGACAAGFVAGCLAMLAWRSAALPGTRALSVPSTTSPALLGAPSASSAMPAAQTEMPLAPAASGAEFAPAPAAAASRSVTLSGPPQLEALLAKIVQPPDPTPQDPFALAADLLRADARARADVMARYTKETNTYARMQLRALLAFVPSEDVKAFAMRMAGDGNAALRSEGFDMLRQTQMSSADARELLINAVATEQDSAVLRSALSALVPGASPAPQEAAHIVEQLNRLVTHSSPEVRGESLLALTRWKRDGAVEETVFAGLSDAHGAVQDAALTALFENPIRSERIKQALLKLAANTGVDAQQRWTALEALGGFQLSQQESTTLAQLRESLPPPQ